jgi:hypothetical protein
VQGSLEREGKREQSSEGEKSLSRKLDSGCSRYANENSCFLLLVKQTSFSLFSGNIENQVYIFCNPFGYQEWYLVSLLSRPVKILVGFVLVKQTLDALFP